MLPRHLLGGRVDDEAVPIAIILGLALIDGVAVDNAEDSIWK
jgi:hypothetical protein